MATVLWPNSFTFIEIGEKVSHNSLKVVQKAVSLVFFHIFPLRFFCVSLFYMRDFPPEGGISGLQRN